MYYIKLTIFLLLPLILKSQEGEQLQLLAKNTPLGVKLKIIPSQMDIWLSGAQNGYIIERENLITGEKISLNRKPIIPAEEDEWLDTPQGESFYKFHLSALENAQPQMEGLTMIEKIAIYEKASEGYLFYFLISTRVRDFSKLSGLEYVDTMAVKGETYNYSIKILGNEHIIGNLNHSFNERQPKSTSPAIKALDRIVHISWPFIEDDILVSFNIEKSSDGINFKAINNAPIYYNSQTTEEDIHGNYQAGHIHRQDSLENNYSAYYYRLVAIDVWGEACIPSDTIQINGQDLTPPKPVDQLKAIKDDASKTITLQWEINYDEPIQGYVVYHSHESQGNYRPIHEGTLPPTTNQFTHDSILQIENQYYKIGTLDTAGNIGFSRSAYSFLIDKDPPDAPNKIKGQCDSLGTVTLSWDSVADLGLKGYMVYGSNSPEKGYINLTPLAIEETSFVDTTHLNRLHTKRYYKLVALDKNFNFSDFSEYISVVLPDTIGPAQPILNKITKLESKVLLSWKPSVSQDIYHYHIQQKRDTTWIHIAETKELTHEIINPGFGELEFRIIGVDTSNNEGIPSFSRSVKFTKSIHTGDSNLAIESNEDYLKLSWDDIDAAFYKVYRIELGGQLKLLTMTKETSYLDRNIKPEKTYFYYIIGQNNKGRRIHKSSTVQVQS